MNKKELSQTWSNITVSSQIIKYLDDNYEIFDSEEVGFSKDTIDSIAALTADDMRQIKRYYRISHLIDVKDNSYEQMILHDDIFDINQNQWKTMVDILTEYPKWNVSKISQYFYYSRKDMKYKSVPVHEQGLQKLKEIAWHEDKIGVVENQKTIAKKWNISEDQALDMYLVIHYTWYIKQKKIDLFYGTLFAEWLQKNCKNNKRNHEIKHSSECTMMCDEKDRFEASIIRSELPNPIIIPEIGKLKWFNASEGFPGGWWNGDYTAAIFPVINDKSVMTKKSFLKNLSCYNGVFEYYVKDNDLEDAIKSNLGELPFLKSLKDSSAFTEATDLTSSGKIKYKCNPDDPAVLFVNMGWSDFYMGEDVIAAHKHVQNNPDNNSEMDAFCEDSKGKVVCGIGSGRIPPQRLDVVLVAKDPRCKVHRVVGIYFDVMCVPSELGTDWIWAETCDYKRISSEFRPKVKWPFGQGTRRWAWRPKASGRVHPDLYQKYREILARLGINPGGYGWRTSAEDIQEELNDNDLLNILQGHRKNEPLTNIRVAKTRKDEEIISHSHVVVTDPVAGDILAYRPHMYLHEVLRNLFSREDLRQVSIASFCSNLGVVELTGLIDLINRSESDAEIRFLLPAPYGADLEFARWLHKQHKDHKLKAYEFHGLGHRKMHVKAILAMLKDGRRIAILGSANATSAALISNVEYSVAFTLNQKYMTSDPFDWFESQWRKSLDHNCELNPLHFYKEKIEISRPSLFYFQLIAHNQLTKKILPLLQSKKAISKKSQQNKLMPGGGLVILPTGAGKTLTALRWIFDEVLSNVSELGRVLWLSHRVELLQQAYDASLHEANFIKGIKPHIVEVGIKSNLSSNINDLKDGHLIIISSQRAHSILKKSQDRSLPEFGLIVIDEAHRASMSKAQYGSLIESLPHRARIGLTATPYRMNDLHGFEKVFQLPDDNQFYGPSSIVEYSIEHIDNKRLPGGMKLFSEQNIEKIETGFRLTVEAGNEIQFRKYLGKFNNSKRNKCVVDTYAKYKKSGATIIFCVSINHANEIAALINTRGGRAQAFHEGDIPEKSTTLKLRGKKMSKTERGQVLSDFRDREIDVLCCVQLLTEGYDLPAISSVMLARPTLSTLLLTQMIGRGIRGPAVGGSEACNIIDFCDQLDIHAKRDAAYRLRVANPNDVEEYRKGNVLHDDPREDSHLL